MPLAPEQTILDGKYRILRLIGEGGMARVWQAEEPRFGGRRVAIKEPRGDLLPQDEEDLRRRYQQEVRICAALEQARVAHIVRALTAEMVEGTLLLVLEYMPGGDLAGLLKEHPGGLPIERAVAIVLDLLRALEGVHSHSLEMVHRDLKPSNVLFDDQGRAYLSDFGLVQLAGVSGRSQLRGGTHPGTPLYMAPEQGRSPDPLAPSADLYALGCVFFEMLTGRRYKRHKPGTRAGTLRPEVPGWLDDIVARALAEDPWERWQTAGEISAALEAGQAADQARREEEAVRQREAQERARREAEAGALRERLAGLEANARVRLSAGDPAAALAVLEQIRHLEPRYPGLAELAAQAQSAMDERQRREVEARRQAQCAESRRMADVALRSGDWPEAFRLAGDLSALGEPGVGWAKEIRRQAERLRRAEEAARRKQEKKRPPWLWPALAALAVMVLAGVLWAAWPDRRPDATPTPTTAAPVAAGATRTPTDTPAPPTATLLPPTDTPAPPTGTPAPTIGSTRLRDTDGMGMVYVPAGEFTMGSPDGEGSSDEHPQHKVTLDSYWIDRTEVTNDQYRKCLTAGACAQPGYWGDGNYNGGSQPVVGVDWNDAVAYCTWAGARLPTEAEWEKAARGMDGRRYPWGNEEPDCNRANFYGCAGKPVAVGSYASGASPYGALDMAGNVWEWVNDWYGSYDASSQQNPQGPASGDARVLRGGSWGNLSDVVRSATRRGFPVNRISGIGFRCVSSSTSSP
jgi:formylglycine-generating enzyme required for sulfatase activity